MSPLAVDLPQVVYREEGRKSERGGTDGWFGNYAAMKDGIKQGGDWFNASQPSISRMSSSKSKARKAASALIAKIPLPLSRYIGSVYRQTEAKATGA